MLNSQIANPNIKYLTHALTITPANVDLAGTSDKGTKKWRYLAAL